MKGCIVIVLVVAECGILVVAVVEAGATLRKGGVGVLNVSAQ